MYACVKNVISLYMNWELHLNFIYVGNAPLIVYFYFARHQGGPFLEHTQIRTQVSWPCGQQL